MGEDPERLQTLCRRGSHGTGFWYRRKGSQLGRWPARTLTSARGRGLGKPLLSPRHPTAQDLVDPAQLPAGRLCFRELRGQEQRLGGSHPLPQAFARQGQFCIALSQYLITAW